MIKKDSVSSVRGIKRGLNAKNGDIWDLKAYAVDHRRTLDTFKALVD